MLLLKDKILIKSVKILQMLLSVKKTRSEQLADKKILNIDLKLCYLAIKLTHKIKLPKIQLNIWSAPWNASSIVYTLPAK